MPARMDPAQAVWILFSPDFTPQEKLAALELARGLRKLGLAVEPRLVTLPGPRPGARDLVFTIGVAPTASQHRDGYAIATEAGEPGHSAPRVRLTGATPQAALYAVFDLLERQGAFFGLDGEVYPLDRPLWLNLPVRGSPWRAQPRFKVRGLVPWPDFLNCLTVFNEEDYRAYLEAMLRMRCNMLGIHVYTTGEQWAEPFLSFEYGGTGHGVFADTTATRRWGYLPQKTSRFGMGGAQFFDDEVFGSDAARLARNTWEAAELAQQLWRDAFRYAERLGIATGVGFEPYQIPDEIFRAVPPEVRVAKKNPSDHAPRVDPESIAARDLLETRLAQLLEAYPSLNFVWLWEDEHMSWTSHHSDVPLSVTPFRQAHDFLRRHAPSKRLVLAGWGGVARHFESFHKQLPGDVIFACLSDVVGWDPVNDAFGKLEDRERWPILWLEDDQAMWLPQFHVHRFERDMNLAEQYGCQGLMGIHWRHRIVDATAGFQSRFSWEGDLKPTAYYKCFSQSLVRAERATKLAKLLDDTDRERRILSSFTGEIKEGHHQTFNYAGDYGEAFVFWEGHEPFRQVRESQQEVAVALSAIARSSSDPAERERIEYLSTHVEFLITYSEAWVLAAQLHKVIQQALDLRRTGNAAEARLKIESDGVPLWMVLAARTREAILGFQRIVSTRNDIGTLASLHNKFVRLALFRLPASMKEFTGELPEKVERTAAELMQPDPDERPRVFVPARPTILTKGQRVRIHAVAPGAPQVIQVTLCTRLAGSSAWRRIPMQFAGRRTFSAQLAPSDTPSGWLDYYVEAQFAGPGGSKRVTAPLEAPNFTYTVTLL